VFPFKDDNPPNIFPVMTLLLIAANIAVAVVQASAGNAQAFLAKFGAIPWEISRSIRSPGAGIVSVSGLPPLATLVTSMFLHGGFLHLAGNMLYLWIFGDNIESLLGRFRFLGFYLACGVLAGLTHTLLGPDSRIPMVGASGAISGVLGAYLIYYPKARVHVLLFLVVFIKVVRIPAVVVLGIWMLVQVLNGMGSLAGADSGNVAWFAHIGGFVSGIVLGFLMPKRKNRPVLGG
jgi:membrane associated rhomboid family serine protease